MKRKKQLTLLISTTQVPLQADIVYAGGSTHVRKPVLLHVHEFRLGELARPSKRSTFSGVEHLRGPWDISGANKVFAEDLRAVKGGPGAWRGKKKLVVGLKQIAEFFGPNRKALLVECLKALNRLDLLPTQGPAAKGLDEGYAEAWRIIESLEKA